jgi:iron complex outermembrane receptor protein
MAGLGYALTSATVQSFAAEPSLEGNDVPQVPRHQGTLTLEYAAPRGLALSLVARLVSQQFEDDQNQLPLAGFFSLDARAAWRFGRRVDLFAAFKNVTGQRYEVGRTPVTNLGPPFLLRAGLRFDGRGASR